MKLDSYLRARRTLALACLTACCSLQAHAGTDLISGSASLANLSFGLVNLAPQSGQDTWIQFGQPGGDQSGWAYVSGLIARDADGLPVGSAGQDMYFESPVPQQSYNLVAADGSGTLSMGPSGYAVTMRLGAEAMDQAIVVPGAATKSIEVSNEVVFGTFLMAPPLDVNYETSTYTVRDRNGAAQVVNFTLSAHTQLVFEADASAYLEAGTDLTYGPWDRPDSPWASAGASISLARGTPLGQFAETYGSWGELSSEMLSLYDWQGDDVSALLAEDPSLMTPTSRRLKVTLKNDSDQAMEGILSFSVGANAMVVQAVPEPSTYMLMGLGLVGIVWRRRKLSN